jgi:hypothetical protein
MQAAPHPNAPESSGWFQEVGMSTTNHPKPDTGEVDGTVPRSENDEQDNRTTDDRDGADPAPRWEDGTAMPYWVAPDDANGDR